MSNLAWIAIIAVATAMAGLWMIVIATSGRQIRLADAVALLDSQPFEQLPEPVRGWGRIGSILTVRLGASLTPAQERNLRLQGKTLSDFFVMKLLGLLAGFVFPLLVAAIVRPWIASGVFVPLIVSLAGGIVGWIWPNIRLHQRQDATRDDASESINTLFDLVVLERLANLSGVQSLEAAASISNTPLFSEITTALDRARLEQRAPWGDLERLAHDIDLPALAELADVMRLDEQGASLSSALLARTRDLRDAHLTKMKMQAHQVSERMTVWMTAPVMVFALAFLVPPILNIWSTT